jgi:ATP-dependent RNA helicase RhlE
MLALWSSVAPAFRAKAVGPQRITRSPDISAKSPVRRSEQSEAMPLDRLIIEKEAPQVNSFQDLPLVEPLHRALAEEGYAVPTPIQAQAIPLLLAGRDLLGIAQTGTGKTAAFALPILQRLAAAGDATGKAAFERRTARCLVLTPTRELAIQIGDSFRAYGRHLGLRSTVIFGGVGQNPQVATMARGVHILVATPGRLLDLIGQGHVRLDRVEIAVLDEADRMLDMGFIHDVKKIVARLPARRQTLLFSATMPADIARLAAGILRDPARIEVTPAASTVERAEQRVMFVERGDKRDLLCAMLKDRALARVLVFTRTKHGANKVAEQLGRAGYRADAIHGNKSQGARQRALEGFRAGHVRVLVATDIAARGIDIDGITHVVNYELPNVPETYVHRIGRTARAGAGGAAISLCDGEERAYLRDIERLIGRKVQVVDARAFRDTAPPRRAA